MSNKVIFNLDELFISVGIDVGADFSWMSIALPNQQFVGALNGNGMQQAANGVYELCAYVDSMTHNWDKDCAHRYGRYNVRVRKILGSYHEL